MFWQFSFKNMYDHFGSDGNSERTQRREMLIQKVFNLTSETIKTLLNLREFSLMYVVRIEVCYTALLIPIDNGSSTLQDVDLRLSFRNSGGCKS
ncbi:hypothetical protein PUN28_012881 [Cardiocondyla obscurior]|uniref:Uncharacterized protein n=1 Tax=Cardiocondyla obscurior TaxID=286306 RepID=A0AAW2FAP7_9HYME